jgi:predicted Fe-Mo cluster-binding NifX family protein
MSKPRSDVPATCVTRYKQVIAGSVIVVVAVMAWTIVGKVSPTPVPTPAAGAMPAATAPPIAVGAIAPHPNFGPCGRCHDILGAGATPGGGQNLVPVAAAPPIAANAALTHPDWGPCEKCHAITKAGLKPAAFEAGQILLGARVQKLTAAAADRMDMEGAKGLVVTEVLKDSAAGKGGLKVDDLIQQVDNTDVATVAELRAALVASGGGSKIKLRVSRGERKKNIFFRLPAQMPAQMPAAPAAPSGSPAQLAAAVRPIAGRVVVAATGNDSESQVAPVFSGAPYFLFRDFPGGPWRVLVNPSPGGAGRGQLVASMLLAQGAGTVIAGNVGPGAFRTLTGAGVQVYSGAFGSVDVVYQAYLQGRLVPAAGDPGPATPAAAATLARGTVAIAAAGPRTRAPISEDLAESPYLIFYDVATGTFGAMANPGARGNLVDGVPLVQLLVDRGATAVIAGRIDPATARELDELGLQRIVGVGGTVEDAARALFNGMLWPAPAGPPL